MDRFFDRLEVGRVVLRSNWSITTHGRLFAASGNHLYAGEDVPEDEVIDMDNVRAGPFIGWVFLTGNRRSLGVRDKLSIAFRKPKRWFLRSRRTCIR